MKLNWMDWSWGWTSRFLMSVGGLWMISTLVGPTIEGEWIVIISAVIALASLVVVRPGKSL